MSADTLPSETAPSHERSDTPFQPGRRRPDWIGAPHPVGRSGAAGDERPANSPGRLLQRLRAVEERPVVLGAMFGLSYFALQYLSLRYLLSLGFAAVWPPAGLAMATFLLTRPRSWRAIVPALVVANTIGNAVEGFGVFLIMGFAIANCVGPLTGALLARRLAPAAATLARPIDVGAFMLFAGAVAPAAGGVVAAAFLAVDGAGIENYGTLFRGWFSADVLGIVVLAPLLLTLAQPRHQLTGRTHRGLQIVPSAVALGLIAQLFLGHDARQGLTVVGLPAVTAALLWPSLFLGRRAVALNIVVVSTVVLVNNALGHSAFTLDEWSAEDQVTAIQLFIVTLSLTHLIVAAMLTQQSSNVAEARRVAAELAARTEDLERSNQELSQFSFVVAHDLAAPLRSISGFAELLQSRYGEQLDERGRTYAGHIVDGAGRLRRLLDGMLEFARSESDPSKHRPVALSDVIDGVRTALGAPIEESGATLVVVDPLPVVSGDEGQLGRLVQNLVSNAVKYRRPDVAPQIRIGVTDRTPELVFVEVADNGIGIEADQRERVFQMFQRLHGRDEHGGGEGIGLSVARKIVESTGGSIRIGDAPGGGCSVVFSLPLAHAIPPNTHTARGLP